MPTTSWSTRRFPAGVGEWRRRTNRESNLLIEYVTFSM
jgi:hypothetical protein